MIRSILVPLDGSTFGEHALPMATSLARRTGATLHLVHVHQPVPPILVAGYTMVDTLDLSLRQDEQAYLADVTRRVRERHPVTIEAALLDGEVAPALREYAAAQEADLVVMSTHGRGALGRFWLGSVTDELVRDPQCHALLVRPNEGKPDLERERLVKTILVPLDGTSMAEQALESALKVGEPYAARFILLRVIEPAMRGSYLPEGTTVEGITHGMLEQIHALHQKVQAEAGEYLQGVADKLRARAIDVVTRVVMDEQPASAILKEAEAGYADLIAMETHGRRGLKRLFLGSVADKVARSGSVPVLLHRSAQ